jgi:alpha-tubulin suppressor-like RCC1 family protein
MKSINFSAKRSVLQISILVAALGLSQAHNTAVADMVEPPFIGKGYNFSVGIRNDGVMVVFGGNNNTFTPKSLPEELEPVTHPDSVIFLDVDKVQDGIPDFSIVAAGLILSDGGVSVSELSWSIPEPQIVLQNETIETVGEDDGIAFAITDAGDAFVWERYTTPHNPVKLNIGEPVKAIDAHYSNSGTAVTESGNVFIWDDVTNPQVTQVTMPEPIKEANMSRYYCNGQLETGVTAVSEDGDVFMWENTVGSQAVELNIPSPVTDIIGDFNDSIAATKDGLYEWEYTAGSFAVNQMLADEPIQEIIGYFHSGAALTDSGEVYAWSHPNSNLQISPVIISNAKALYDYGGDYVLTNDGKVFKIDAEYNSGSYTGNTTQITGLPNNIEEVYPGQQTVALTTTGDVYTWEYNSTTATKVPLPFDSPVTYVAEDDASHALVLLENGMMCGWGNNDYGQLGSGNPKPVPVNEPVCLEDLTVKLPLQCDDVSTTIYQADTKKLSFNKLAMELYSPWTDQPTGKFALFQAPAGANVEMQAYPGFLDFRLPSRVAMDFVETIEDSSCYPMYSAQQETVTFPKVQVPLVGVDWNSIVTPTEVVECYTATMKQAVTQSVFSLTEVTPIDCE